MVIIEAHRLGCWNALVKTFKVETVDYCVIECASGNRMRKGYVPLDDARLRSEMVVHDVTTQLVTGLIARAPSAAVLDRGEKELLACFVTQAPMPFLGTCDKAAIRTMHALGAIHHVVPLEEAAELLGLRTLPLGLEHTRKWLSEFRLKLELDIL